MFKGTAPQAMNGSFESPVDVELETAECPAFMGRTIKGIKNGPSPAWLVDRLTSIGLRPISILVDITNFITYDRGRPLHVYDADKLSGNIRARAGIDLGQGRRLAEHELPLRDCAVGNRGDLHVRL